MVSSTIRPALAPPILTAMMLLMGWPWMFIILGLLGIIVSIGWYSIYRNRSQISLTQDEIDHLSIGEDKQISNEMAKPSFREWIRLFKHTTTWGLIFGFMGVIYMLWLYLPGYQFIYNMNAVLIFMKRVGSFQFLIFLLQLVCQVVVGLPIGFLLRELHRLLTVNGY